jgi:hypothetical protein
LPPERLEYSPNPTVECYDFFKFVLPNLTYSVEKLRFASGAKIHEEFNSVLRAITGTG